MPIDLYSDFRTQSLSKEDDLWSSLAIGVAAGLVELEPRIRMRIRNLPTMAKVVETIDPKNNKKRTQVKSASGGDTSLIISDVPEILRDRLEIPAERKFWARIYNCKTCGRKAYEVEVQKKKHDGHDLEPIRIVKRGLLRSWEPSFRVCMGPSTRLSGNALPTYSIAITAPPIDINDLSGKYAGNLGYSYHSVLIVPIRKSFDYEAEKARLFKALPEVEKVEILPRNPADLAPAILAFVKALDPELLDPEGVVKAANADSYEELKKQLEADGIKVDESIDKKLKEAR